MNTKQNKFMSPSLSTTSIPCSTQAPTSIIDSLPSFGISIEDAEKWNREYNYETIPRLHEHKFWGLLIEVASDHNPADIDFESKVRSVMEQKNARSRAEFEEQAYQIMLPGAELFEDPSQKSVFLSALDEQHTLHSYEGLITNCLPVLVNALQQNKLEQRQRNGPTRKKPGSRRVSKTSSESGGRTGARRSLRLKKPQTPPSE
jgi:hypothetical protein